MLSEFLGNALIYHHPVDLNVNFKRLKVFKNLESYVFSILIYISGLIIISDAFIIKLLILFETVVFSQYVENHKYIFFPPSSRAGIILQNKGM